MTAGKTEETKVERVLAATVAELEPGTSLTLHRDDPIAVYHTENGEFFATVDICSHDEASLSDGELFGHTVECPLHGARFDVRTGKALTLPAVYPVKTFEVRVVGGQIQVRV